MTNPKKRLQLFSIITLVLLAGGIAIILTKPQNLAKLETYEGILQEMSMRRINDGAPTPAIIDILSFKVKGLDIKFGIHEQFKSYDGYVQNLHIGDTVKVYYDKWGSNSEGFNLRIGQIEKNGVALIDVAERDDENKIAGFVFLVVGIIFLIVTIRFYLTKVRVSKTMLANND